MDLDAERTNEFEAQFFGFSPIGFSDTVHNEFVQSWKEVTEKLFKDERMKELCKSKSFKLKVTHSLFNDVYKKAIEDVQKNSLKYVFRIPDHVTLPEHRPQLEIPEDFDRAKLEQQIRHLEKEVIRKRVTLKKQEHELRDIDDAIQVLKEVDSVSKRQTGRS